MPKRCVGESRRIFIIQNQNHFYQFPLLQNFLHGSEKLTLLIIIARLFLKFHAHARVEGHARAHVNNDKPRAFNKI